MINSQQSQQEKKILIIYGSETNICSSYAHILMRLFLKNNIHVHICQGNLCDSSVIKELTHLIIITSNTKEGQPPTNIELFYYFLLRKSLSPELFSSLSYTVIGMGNSTYEKHNRVGKVLDARLESLGATKFFPSFFLDKRGYKDCCHGYMEKISKLVQTFRKEPIKEDDSISVYEKLQLKDNPSLNQMEKEQEIYYPPGRPEEESKFLKRYSAQQGLSSFKIIENSRMTSETHWQNVRRIQFSSSSDSQKSNPIPFQDGDTIALAVPNLPENVLKLLHLLRLSPSAHVLPNFSLRKKEIGCLLCEHHPSFKSILSASPLTQSSYDSKDSQNIPLTLYTFFERFFELGTTVPFYFLRLLAAHCSNPSESAKLLHLSSPEGTEDFYYYAFLEKRNVVEILSEFPSCSPPLELILEFLPFLRERQFSIVNSSCEKLTHIETLVVAIEYKTPYKRSKKGLFANYIEKGQLLSFEGRLMHTALSRARERLHTSKAVFICTGTGISAAMAFLRRKNIENLLEGNILVFGFRSKQTDFHYKYEIEGLEKKGLKVYLAESRPVLCEGQEVKKEYVNELIENNTELGEEIWNILEKEKGIVVICGKAGAMPRGVRKGLRRVIEDRLGSESEALLYYGKMEREYRVFEETWA